MRPLRVIHIEDDLLDAELVASHLDFAGLEPLITRVASRAAFDEALGTCKADIILADYSMPSFDGMSALEMVRARGIEVPFVFVSGALGEELAIESLKRGATDYVLKTNMGRLLPAVQRALREASERSARKRSEEERERLVAALQRESERLQETVSALTESELRYRTLLREQTRKVETLQRSLLLVPSPSAFPGLDFEPKYEAAWEESSVGGDFYDVFRIDDRRVAFVIGDVTGKGLRAATHTAEVKFALRGFIREDADPATTLFRLSRYLVDAQRLDNQSEEVFVSMLVFTLDPHSGSASVAAAGSDPPIILRASGETEICKASGLILGAAPEIPYHRADLTIFPGDTILMVTDGITEARHGLEFFGFEGFIEAAEAAAQSLPSLTAMGDAIVDAAKRFAGEKLHDDVCLLLVRRE